MHRVGQTGAAETTRFLLRVVAAALGCVYIVWNVFWLTQGRLAPALFLAITGLPSPTTGCTRSLLAFSRGQWMEGLRHNPFSLVFICLLLASAGTIAASWRRERRLALPPRHLKLWLAALGMAWAYKLATL